MFDPLRALLEQCGTEVIKIGGDFPSVMLRGVNPAEQEADVLVTPLSRDVIVALRERLAVLVYIVAEDVSVDVAAGAQPACALPRLCLL